MYKRQVFGLLEGFLAAKASGSVPVFCAFDNEEVGSETKQGAASSLLGDTLRRIALALGLGEEGYLRLLAQSFLVSADNAHAVHPNHPEYADMTNTPRMNGGVVIKFNANQRYTTDGVSCALFTAVCREAKAPVQVYATARTFPAARRSAPSPRRRSPSRAWTSALRSWPCIRASRPRARQIWTRWSGP